MIKIKLEDDVLPHETKEGMYLNVPTVQALENDLIFANAFHTKEVEQVNGHIAAMEAKIQPNIPSNKSNMISRVIKKAAVWRYSSLAEPFLSSSRVITVKPVSEDDVLPALQHQALVNFQLTQQMNWQKFIDEYVRVCVDEGSVIVKVGWKKTQLILGRNEDGTLQSKISEDRPDLTVCKFDDVIIDPSCMGIIEDAKFIIHRRVVSISDLLSSPQYKNVHQVVNNGEGYVNSSSTRSVHYADMENRDYGLFTFQSDDLRAKVELKEYWGYWDLFNTGMLTPILASYVGNTMVQLDISPIPSGKLPFAIASYEPVTRKVRGEPDAPLLQANQAVKSALLRMQIDSQASSIAGQTAVMTGVLDPINQQRLDNGENFEVDAEVLGSNKISDLVQQMSFAEVPDSNIQLSQAIQQDADELTGIKPFGNTQTNMSNTRKTPLDAPSIREQNILRRLADGIKNICDLVIDLNKVMLSVEQQVTTTDMAEFVNIDPADLQNANVHASVEVETLETRNANAEELAFLSQTIMPVDPKLGQALAVEYALNRGRTVLADKIANYTPPPPTPLEQAAQKADTAKVIMETLQIKLQNAKLKAETDKLEKEAKKTAVDTLKSATDSFKNVKQAQQIDAETDQTNLDFVNDESGLTHARQKDLIVSQQVAAQHGNLEMQKAKEDEALLKLGGELLKQNNEPVKPETKTPSKKGK